MHYLDDFITAGLPAADQCALNLQTAVSVCKNLGLPFHPGKFVGSSTRLVVLGIQLDSVDFCAHLPDDKLVALKDLVTLVFFWFC